MGGATFLYQKREKTEGLKYRAVPRETLEEFGSLLCWPGQNGSSCCNKGGTLGIVGKMRSSGYSTPNAIPELYAPVKIVLDARVELVSFQSQLRCCVGHEFATGCHWLSKAIGRDLRAVFLHVPRLTWTCSIIRMSYQNNHHQ